jgi:hypothetical protein
VRGFRFSQTSFPVSHANKPAGGGAPHRIRREVHRRKKFVRSIDAYFNSHAKLGSARYKNICFGRSLREWMLKFTVFILWWVKYDDLARQAVLIEVIALDILILNHQQSRGCPLALGIKANLPDDRVELILVDVFGELPSSSVPVALTACSRICIAA